jgi:hypothetical protein
MPYQAAQEPDYTHSKCLLEKSAKSRQILMPLSAKFPILTGCMSESAKLAAVRHMGWRPSVRGKAMNPIDHPHGGGEGHNPIGLKYPKTPWGKHALGVRLAIQRNLPANLY